MAASSAVVAPETKLEGLSLYSRFAFAGAVCCSVTHGAFTPVDVYAVPSALAPVSNDCGLLTLPQCED